MPGRDDDSAPSQVVFGGVTPILRVADIEASLSFYVESLGRTTAELSPEQKNEISHRGKALRWLKALMDRVPLGDNA